MVYLIENLNNSTYKIGYSQNPNKRLQSLQTSTSDTLVLISTIEGDLSLEKSLHKKFKQFHLIREWFKKDEMILKEFNPTAKKHTLDLDENYYEFNIDILSFFKKLNGSDLKVYFYLLEKYNTTCLIVINDILRKDICTNCKLKSGTINNSLNALCKVNLGKEPLLKKAGKGTYLINDIYFK